MSDFETVPLGTTTELESVKQERDELAAHVERLNEAGKAIQHELAQWALTEQDPETSAAMCQFDQVARETPTTSLARRDLIKQAEALEIFVDDVKSMHPKASPKGISSAIKMQANGLRKQAKELDT